MSASSARGEILQMGAAGVGERVFAVVAHFDFRRQHGAKRFADGREVVAADPVAEFDEFRRQRRNGIEHFGDFFDARFHRARHRGGCERFFESQADHRAIAKGHQHAAADERFAVERRGQRVGERGAQRNGKSDFAVAGIMNACE